MRKGKEMFSDNRVKVRLDIGENAFEVRFVREYTFDMDNRLDDDMAEDVEVLVGETWTAIESINRWTRTDIEGALDKWMYENPPDLPEYLASNADRLYDAWKDSQLDA